jgi:hypothetical protein
MTKPLSFENLFEQLEQVHVHLGGTPGEHNGSMASLVSGIRAKVEARDRTPIQKHDEIQSLKARIETQDDAVCRLGAELARIVKGREEAWSARDKARESQVQACREAAEEREKRKLADSFLDSAAQLKEHSDRELFEALAEVKTLRALLSEWAVEKSELKVLRARLVELEMVEPLATAFALLVGVRGIDVEAVAHEQQEIVNQALDLLGAR